MNYEVKCRVINMAKMILDKKTTVREVAKEIGYSKSTVHKDLREKLPLIDKNLYHKVCELLEYNKEIRHIRGGESTKIHYALLKFPFEKYQGPLKKSVHKLNP